MAITHRVLGRPGRDNALWAVVDRGQGQVRLLFDCGGGCLSGLPLREIQATDHLFFSHLHMDHVAGFDDFFRCTYDRTTQPNLIWGPPGTADIMHHRFRGFWWNLAAGRPGHWQVHDVHPGRVVPFRFDLGDGFAGRRTAGEVGGDDTIIRDPAFVVRALHLDHHGPCLGYLVRERPRRNVATDRLAALGLRPGPWLEDLRQHDAPADIVVDGVARDRRQLRSELLVETPGASLAYLTDFRLDAGTTERLATDLQGCDTLVCEAQYRAADHELAARHAHTTVDQVARLAARAGVGELVLFHLSDRYAPQEWRALRDEARRHFPASRFPGAWDEILGT